MVSLNDAMGGSADVEAADGSPGQAGQAFDLQAIIKQVRAAKEDGGGPGDYGRTIGEGWKAGSKACAVPVMACFSGLYLAMLVIGVIYLDDCRVNDKIPIWLIVFGVFGWLKLMLENRNWIPIGRCRNQTEEEMEKSPLNKIVGVLNFFLFAWFITGNVWVFEQYGYVNYENTTALNYCNQTAYLFAFWVMVALYIVIAIVIGLTCLCGCVGCFACACCKMCK